MRYDLKDLKVEIDVSDEKSQSRLNLKWRSKRFGELCYKNHQQKTFTSNLKKGELMKMGGSNVRIEIKLVKVLDQEIAKSFRISSEKSVQKQSQASKVKP